MTTRTLSPDKQAQKAVTRVLDHEFMNAVKVGRQSARHKSSMPVLNCVLVKKTAHKVEIISTDLETVSRGSVQSFTQSFYDLPQDADMGPDWAVCVPQKPLFDWLRVLGTKAKMPQGELEIEFEHRALSPNGYSYAGTAGDWLKVKAGTITARFCGIEADEFPYLDDKIPTEGVLDNFVLPCICPDCKQQIMPGYEKRLKNLPPAATVCKSCFMPLGH